MLFSTFILSGVKAAALMSQCPEVKPSVEEGHITEQQLGLRQAEERLYRDYIHRLLKVGKPAWSWGSLTAHVFKRVFLNWWAVAQKWLVELS